MFSFTHPTGKCSKSKVTPMEYNMRNILLEKVYIKYGGETSPRPFPGKLKLCIFLNQ